MLASLVGSRVLRTGLLARDDLLQCSVVCPSCFIFIGKIPEVLTLAVDFDLSNPLVRALVPDLTGHIVGGEFASSRGVSTRF
jgi:hypothetical protein